jgi:branched-chain amino acid transport system permease protein
LDRPKEKPVLKIRWNTVLVLLLAGAVLIFPLMTAVIYLLNVLILFFLYASLGLCWDLVASRAGLMNLGQAAFFGIGGYTMGILWLGGISPLFGGILGGLLAMIFAALVSPSFRLRGMYFAVATLGLAEVVRIGVINWYQVTGGAQGLYLPIPKEFSIVPYYLSLFILVSTILGTKLYLKSPAGLAVMAIREDEDASEALGVDVFRYKVLTFMVSAFFVGIAGGFYAYYLSYVEPNNLFGIFWSITPLFIVIIGGGGSGVGPIIGAAFYVFLLEILQSFTTIPELNTVIFGVALIVLMILRPGGLIQILSKSMK